MSIASIDLGSSPNCPSPNCSGNDSKLAHQRLRAIHKIVCSDSWAEHCVQQLSRIEARRSRIVPLESVEKELDQAGIYPPGGKPRKSFRRTSMRCCRRCNSKWYPPQYVHRYATCDDCMEAARAPLPSTDEKTHLLSTSSPTTLALLAMEEYQVHLNESRLPPEDEASLRKEIEAFYQASKGKGAVGAKHDF